MVTKDEPIISTKGFLTFHILHELHSDKLCGDDLAVIIGNRKKGKLTPGTIYPALKILRKKKLVKHIKTGRKKIYTITENGVNEYKKVRENFFFMFGDLIKKSKKRSNNIGLKKIEKNLNIVSTQKRKKFDFYVEGEE